MQFTAEHSIMKKTISFIIFALVLLSQSSFAAFNQAPDITLPGVEGNIQLESLRGKVVYLDFWASWCVPCKKSFPWMRDMKRRYADQGFEILAVNLDKDRKLADEFLKEMDVNFKVAFDESGKSASEYKLRGMPSSYLIGRDGKVHASHIGFRDKDKEQLEQAIKSLLIK
jgi:cytochrome c biogenesis protein CcmG/thiol:disulfide interchange protein DsbE